MKFQTGIWKTENKLSLVIDNEDKGVVVAVIDPIHEEIVMISVPENTELEAARNLGSWKIGSIWQLGKNEKLGGKLLAETVTRSLHMPVYAWADESMISVINNRYSSFLKFLSSRETNFTLKDRLNIVYFSYRLDSSRKHKIDLSNTNFLSEQKLTDGVLGYKTEGNPSPRISSYFADEYIASNPTRVIIFDASSKPLLAKRMGRVVETIGAKISAIREETHEVSDCEIAGKDETMTKRLALYFDCETSESTSTSFDLEIRIGEDFAERY